MKSKTSFFNKTVFQKDVKKMLPLLILETLGMLYAVFILCTRLSMETQREGVTEKMILISRKSLFARAVNLENNSFLVLVMAGIVALFLFHYIYNKQACFSMHAMPLTRKEWFITHYIAGVFIIMLPYFITLFGLLLAQQVYSLSLGLYTLYFFIAQIGKIIFFYSLMSCIIMICGNSIIAISVYGVGNVLVFATFCIYGILSSMFSYNQSNMETFMTKFQFLVKAYTPVLETELGQNSNYGILVIPKMINDGTKTGGFAISAMGIIIYTILGIVLAVVACKLYEKRQLEKTGESIVYNWGYQVYRFVFTILGAAFLALICTIIFCSVSNYGNGIFCNRYFVSTLIICLICAVICYFIAEMILQKRLAFWKQFKVMPLVTCLAVIFVIFVCARMDNSAGIAPKESKIEFVEVDSMFDGSRICIRDKQQIAWIRNFQKKVYDDCHNMTYYGDTTTVRMVYHMKNGETRTVDYPVPDTENKQSWNNQLEQYLSKQPEQQKLLFSDWYEKLNVNNMEIYYGSNTTTVQNIAQMQEIYQAICKDLQEGNIITYQPYDGAVTNSEHTYYVDVTGSLTQEAKRECKEAVSTQYADMFSHVSHTIPVTKKAVHTMEALQGIKMSKTK